MTPLRGSLRFQLAVAGFGAIYFPVLVLFAVIFAAGFEDETVVDSSQSSAPASAPESGMSPWVIVTVVVLMPVATATAWWWAGRAVAPIHNVQTAIDGIRGDDLQRRLNIQRGPSEVVALAASFDDMLERLHSATQVQRQLIEETSHELRTPLAVLTTNADVLLADPAPTPEAYRAGLERSRLTAERLSAIINELLVDARGRARTIDRRPTDLTTVVRSAVDVVEPLATKRRISIDLDAPEALPCAVDESNVLRAVTNLIDNAVRYAPADTVVAVELTSDAHEVCVAVTDHGPGVPPADQEAVFERFWRTGEQAAGTGLGLSISQHIARAHGGAITLTSPGPAGDGSRFELRLPIPDRSVRPPSERDE